MTFGGNNFSRTLNFNFQDFPGPGILKKKSRTFQEAWEPCIWQVKQTRTTAGTMSLCKKYQAWVTCDLWRSGDHVLDEVTMSRSVDDRDVVLRRLKLPQRNIDRDAALTLGFQLIQHPRILERTFAHLSNKSNNALCRLHVLAHSS